MEIKVFYEKKTEETRIEVPEDECTIMIQTDYERRLREAVSKDEILPRSVQEIIDDEINKPTFNNNQTETRRHSSLEAMSEAGFDFIGENGVTATEDKYADLREAIMELNEEQRELVDMIFFKGMKQKDVALIKGISASAITQRMAVIYSQLKKSIISKKF